MTQEFEARKNELLDDVRGVLKEAETLYQSAVDDGTVEAKELKAKLKIQLDKAKQQYASIEATVTDKAKEAARMAEEAASLERALQQSHTEVAGSVRISASQPVACMLLPPVVGGFQGGVGLFEGEELFEGRPVRVRFEWSQMHTGAPRWQQAFSDDGGATWEVNWVMEFARLV